MSEHCLTEFEIRVMEYANEAKRLPLGNKRIAWAGAARRLQKRGLLMQLSSGGWTVTKAGEQALSITKKMEAAEEWANAPAIDFGPEVQP